MPSKSGFTEKRGSTSPLCTDSKIHIFSVKPNVPLDLLVEGGTNVRTHSTVLYWIVTCFTWQRIENCQGLHCNELHIPLGYIRLRCSCVSSTARAQQESRTKYGCASTSSLYSYLYFFVCFYFLFVFVFVLLTSCIEGIVDKIFCALTFSLYLYLFLYLYLYLFLYLYFVFVIVYF